MIERGHSLLDKLRAAVYQPLAPELVEFQAEVLRGEAPELLVGGKLPQTFDEYGETMRIRTPWGKDGLERSHIARVNKTGEVTCQLEGFFHSDRRDWPK
jgi:hypothetical protein